MRWRRRLSFVLTGIVAVAFLVAGCQSRGGTPRSESPSGSARGPGISRVNLHTLALSVPRRDDLSHADPARFAAALGNDPDRMFAFVRNSIAYETYHGLLRGPRGTLLAAAGNSVDRAALLGAMLEHGGQRVRFARGSLDQGRARDLVLSMWAKRDEMPVGPPPDVAPEVKAIAETLPTAARRDFGLIQDRLKSLGVQLRRDSVPSLELLTQEAQQHYWVQWSKDGRWIDLDPSFLDARPGQAYAKPDALLPTLPVSLAHQVRVRIIVEEYTGSTASTRQILTYSASAADLSASDLVLLHVPENWRGPAGSPGGAIAQAVSNTGRIRPALLVGTQHVMGEPFRPAMPPRGLGGIGPMLSGGGARGPSNLGTAEFLEVEFLDPSGATETIRREIFDVVGAARRAAGQAPTQDELQQTKAPDVTRSIYSLYVTTGRIDAGHVLSTSPTTPSPADPNGIDVRALLTRLHIAFAVLSDSLATRAGQPDRAVVLFYPDSPRLTIVDVEVRDDSLRFRLDLRRDRARAVATGPQPEAAVLARIQRGVLNGTLERTLLAYVSAPAPGAGRTAGTGFSTSVLFDAAQAERLRMLALPQERSRVSGVHPDALARLDADVARGYVAVAPERAPSIDGTPRYAWWRIHPSSGETTAVTDEGLHAAGVEQPTHTAVVGPNLVTGATEVRIYLITLTGRAWVETLVAADIARWGGIAAVLRLLREGGIERVFR